MTLFWKWLSRIITFFTVMAIIYGIFQNEKWFVENGPALIGWLLLAVQSLYMHEEGFYWLVQKAYYFLVNPDTEWDLVVRYEGLNINPELIQQVQKELFKLAQLDRAECRTLSDQRFEIIVDALIVELYFDFEDRSLDVFFRKIPVSFRGSERTLQKRISPVLEELENQFTITSKRYWLTVYFGGMNPYFGLYIKRLRQKEVVEMNITIKIDHKENVEVSKDKLTITTTTRNDLGESVSKYLTLSKLPA